MTEYTKHFELPSVELANQILADLKKHGGVARQEGCKLYFPDKMTFDYSVYHHLVKIGPDKIKTIVKG